MPTRKEIEEALLKQNTVNDPYDVGWNQGVVNVTSGEHTRCLNDPADWDDPPHYVGGFYYNLEDENYYGDNSDFYSGWNEGKEAALNLQEGKTPVTKEKTEEQIQYDRRMKCFSMAEKYSPARAIRGGDREPIGETIARAEALHNYFFKGVTPGTPVVEGA